jgi:hypothetical protein
MSQVHYFTPQATIFATMTKWQTSILLALQRAAITLGEPSHLLLHGKPTTLLIVVLERTQ